MNDINDVGGEVSARDCAVAPSRAEERRGRIIAAGRTLFAENGFHNTGIAQIAKYSGVLVGQIYRDFANKEEIVAEIVEHDLESFLLDGALDDAIAAQDEAAVLQWIAKFIASDEDHDVRLVAEIIAESSRNDRIAAIFRTVQDRLMSSIMSALETLAPEPEKARRRKILAEVILTMSAGTFQRRMGQGAPLDPEIIVAVNKAVAREIDLLQRV